MVYTSRFPQAFIQEFTTKSTNNGGPMLLVIEIIIWLLVIVACVLLTMAIRDTSSTLVVLHQEILNKI
jgi:hypothetical protein